MPSPIQFINNNSTPAEYAVAVTKSDSTVLNATRALYIGGDGNVAVTMSGGGDATFVGLLAGTILPVRVTKVLSTGTTATNIVALY